MRVTGGHDVVATKASVEEAELVAIAHDALLVTDPTGRISFANPAAASLLHAPADALRGRLLVSQVDPAHRGAFDASLDRAAAGEEVRFSFEVAPSGAQPFRVQAHVVPLTTGLGWVLCEEAPPPANLFGSDQPARAQLGRVLDGVRDGVVVLGSDARVEYANRPAQSMFAPHALVRGEIVPDPWPVSIRRLTAELFVHDAFNAEALIDIDTRTAYWVRAHRSGEGDTAVLLLSDLSAEERRETAERDFVAHAAHELQSPLTGIAGAVEVLLDGAHEDPPARVRFLKHIARESDRLSRLLRGLLVLAHAQASGDEAELTKVDLFALLERIVRDESFAASVDVVCPRSLHVLAHPDLVAHALSNLIGNAVRHGGSSRVVVSGRRGTGGTVSVDVTDLGSGISPEQRERVFVRFYRGVATSGEGFGLGLAIARQAARAVGGDVELRANPRGGTIATLTLNEAR